MVNILWIVSLVDLVSLPNTISVEYRYHNFDREILKMTFNHRIGLGCNDPDISQKGTPIQE